jgi:uncharacterized protein
MEGRLGVERVPRIAGACGGLGEGLTVRLRFGKDEAGVAFVDVSVEGVYEFTCQRCLGAVKMTRHDRSRVLVARDDVEARALEAQGEALVCPPGASIALDALVEDEVLLALPLAPCHVPEGDGPGCHAPGRRRRAQTEERDEPDAPAGRRNPFAVLATLKEGAEDGSREP